MGRETERRGPKGMNAEWRMGGVTAGWMLEMWRVDLEVIFVEAGGVIALD